MKLNLDRQAKIVSASSGEISTTNSASIKAAQAMFKKHNDNGLEEELKSESTSGSIHTVTEDTQSQFISSLRVSPVFDKQRRKLQNPIRRTGTINGSRQVGQCSSLLSEVPSETGSNRDGIITAVATAAATKAVQHHIQTQEMINKYECNVNTGFFQPPSKVALSKFYSRSNSNTSSISVVTSGNESHKAMDSIITSRQNEIDGKVGVESFSDKKPLISGDQFSFNDLSRRVASSCTYGNSIARNTESQASMPQIVSCGSVVQESGFCDSQSMVFSLSDTDLDYGAEQRKPLALTSREQSGNTILPLSNRHSSGRVHSSFRDMCENFDSFRLSGIYSSSLSSQSSYADGDDNCSENEINCGHPYSIEQDSELNYSDEDSTSNYDELDDIQNYLNLQDTYEQDGIDLDSEDSEVLGVEDYGLGEEFENTRPKNFTVSNVPYSTLTKIPMDLRLRGTLPNLIPNYQRKGRKWLKIFRRVPKHPAGNEALDQLTSQIDSQDDGALIQSKFRVKLKKTMRGILTDSPSSEISNANEEDYTDDSDDKILYTNRNIKKQQRKSGKKRERIRNNFRYRGTFDEDMPWKFHVDIDYVTERERKRYESMWVSNKDTYLELLPWWNNADLKTRMIIPEDGLMINIVVSDIWNHSNLPQGTLAQIYDMVDTRQDGTLDRNSFVVGMWLVDQSLYGRKLPQKLDSKVWDSVNKYVINVGKSNKNPKYHHRTRKKLLKKELKLIKKISKSNQ